MYIYIEYVFYSLNLYIYINQYLYSPKFPWHQRAVSPPFNAAVAASTPFTTCEPVVSWLVVGKVGKDWMRLGKMRRLQRRMVDLTRTTGDLTRNMGFNGLLFIGQIH